MKLNDLIYQGTYAAVKPVGGTIGLLAEWMVNSNLVDLLPIQELHVTILYSRKRVHISTRIDEYHATPIGWDTFKNSNGTMALVLLLDSPGLTKRHDELIRCGGTHDWPSYKPHLTLSYNFTGNLDDLEPIQHGLLFGKEYNEVLQLD